MLLDLWHAHFFPLNFADKMINELIFGLTTTEKRTEREAQRDFSIWFRLM